MPYPDDDHCLKRHLIAQNIGWNGREFSQAWPDRSGSLGMLAKTVASPLEPNGHTLGGEWTELAYIGPERRQIRKRSARPDYLNHDAGAGFSSAVPQVSSQAATSA